jgi:hypothetical protein
MAIIEVVNKTIYPISTTIGSVEPGVGQKLRVYSDNIPIQKKLYDELEGLRAKNFIEYDVLEDPGMRDEIETAFYKKALGSSLGTIGEPTDGSYADGYFDYWTKDTKIADAVDDVSETILAIAPAKAGLLTGTTLILSGVTQYSAKIPSGLSGLWGGVTPGTLIASLIYNPTYTLTVPDPTTRFRSGKATDLSTAGIFTHVINGAAGSAYDIGQFGPGTIGPITISSLVIYNTIWLKANAYIIFTQPYEGRMRHAASHSEAGLSSDVTLYYDDVNTAPSFSSALAAIINTTAPKWLSGIEALGFGSTIDIGYVAASGIFTKAYHPTAVGTVTCPGHTTSLDNPVTPPDVSDALTVSRTITLDAANQMSLVPQVIATIQKPNGASAASNVALPMFVNTYGTLSTSKADQFVDEARRVVLNSGTYSGNATPFVSTAALVNGNAQQRHNGVLQYPNSTEYPGFTGPQQYQRFISKPSASTGLLNISIPYTGISKYNTGALNMLIHLSTTGKYFDLGTPVGSYNGDGSGSSPANSIGARNDSTSSGNVVGWSLGTYSTAFNNNEYRLIILFNNNTLTLDSISEA